MRQTSGIIINDDIFINSSHVVKIEKIDTDKIEIYLSNVALSMDLDFKDENDRNVIFNKLVMEMYGNNYAHLDFEVKKISSTMSDSDYKTIVEHS